MRAQKIKLIVATVIALGLIPNQIATAGTKIPTTVASVGLSLVENSELGRVPSVYFGTADERDSRTQLICDGLEDEFCASVANVGANWNWDVCDEKSQLSCIGSLWAVDGAGKKVDGIFERTVPLNSPYSYDENVVNNLPRSRGLGGLWHIPGVLNSAGKDTYFVSVLSILNTRKQVGQKVSATKFLDSSFIAGIIPVEEISGSYELKRAVDVKKGAQAFGSTLTPFAPDGAACAAVDLNSCQATRDFTAGYRFGLTLHFGSKLNGWFHGRLSAPQISVSTWKTGEEISIVAEPVRVPALDFSAPTSTLTQTIRDFIFSDREFGTQGSPDGSIRIVDSLSGQDAMNLVNIFAPVYKDIATRTSTYWSFRTLGYSERNDDVWRCSNTSATMAGIVTTNALAYSAGPPNFDVSNGILQYKVSSPHFESNGTSLAVGNYDLSVRSDVARCIYKFSKAPIKAEISIVNQNGENQVATTTVTEKDGWLYLSAKGFTYSSPTLKIKLSQDALPSITTNANSKSSPSSNGSSITPKKSQSRVITCVKGKTIKKISGPKCPVGFKQK